MKLLVTLLLILGVTTYAQGLDCYVCSGAGFDGGDGGASDDCTKDLDPATSTLCADNTGVEYCKTVFTIKDGVPTGVERSCTRTATDTDTVPSNKCDITFPATGNAKTTSTCEYNCNDADDCNSQLAASLKVCDPSCATFEQCNYLDGNCACNTGFSGSDCSTVDPVPRSCVQCSTETDSTCSSTTASSPCNGRDLYCSTTKSTIYDPSDAVISTITTRGCTDEFRAVDECVFSIIETDSPISDNSVGYKEYTCFSTCATDGCNTNTANNAIDGNEFAGLYCVQCSDTVGTGDCNTETDREACPSGTTHCKSTVTYFISEVNDRPYLSDSDVTPPYQLRSVVRECATAAVTASCSETSVAALDGVKKVTCTETCTDDGCNVGWPFRPKCITCATPGTITDFDGCLDNPPEAAPCTYPYQKYCVIMDIGIKTSERESIQGYPRRITRKCSHVDIGTSCSSSTPRITGVDSCNRTCTTDGCNVGSGSSMPIISLLALLIPTVLGWLAQAHL